MLHFFIQAALYEYGTICPSVSSKISKNWQSPPLRKIHFCPNLDKMDPKWPRDRVFWICWQILSLFFLGKNLKWKYCCWYFTINPVSGKFLFSSYVPKCWQPSKSQDSLKCNISKKKWTMKFIFAIQINIENFLQVDTIILGVCNQACSKYPK